VRALHFHVTEQQLETLECRQRSAARLLGQLT
jgi:hypothetical protein